MSLFSLRSLRSLATATLLAFTSFSVGCAVETLDSDSNDITDVKHTAVERQSIGNCWLYAEASWIESMHLNATGKEFDVSQSYWTYWHWYEQIIDERVSEIETGGFFHTANQIILRRGIMPEDKFVKEDTTSEMSSRQSQALSRLNQELKTGRLKDAISRGDRALVRKVMDDAWQLSSTVKGQLTKAFGKDYSRDLRNGGSTYGTSIVDPKKFAVRYTARSQSTGEATVKDATVDVAIAEWREARYPTWGSDLEAKQRAFQIRVQRALHDSQPVVITWDVDFNAMEGSDPVLRGSFNMTTLKKAGKPGSQGGHMTVLEDYEADTVEYGILKAGVTLDPSLSADKAKLDAALLPSSTLRFVRVKNSWGALRDDRSSAPGFPGYHDLYLDYLNGPIAFCPDQTTKTNENCKGQTIPFDSVVLPPGY